MVAGQAEVSAIVGTVTSAFFHDPLWGPVFPSERRRAEQASELWRFFVTSALRYPWTFVTEGAAAAAVWFPPGGTELTEYEQARLEPFLVGIVGRSGANEILAISEQFESARPAGPHFYLSLLATHADHQGQGWGMGLLRENLARIDALGMPAYLESSNPTNNDRYGSVGFAPQQELVMPSGQVVTTMWRPKRGAITAAPTVSERAMP